MKALNDNERGKLCQKLRSMTEYEDWGGDAADEIERLAKKVQILEEVLQMSQQMNRAAQKAGFSVDLTPA